MSDDHDQTPRPVRVRLFGEVDVEGEGGDRSVRLKPLSRALLARLALAPGERVDTEELAKLLVVKVQHGTAVGPEMLSSAQQQLRNAQWQLRKRLGKGRGGGRLLGAGRHWVALEGVRTDYREFLDAVDRGDFERARTIAARGEFLAGIDDPWTAEYRRSVEQRLRMLATRAGRDGEAAPAGDGSDRPTDREGRARPARGHGLGDPPTRREGTAAGAPPAAAAVGRPEREPASAPRPADRSRTRSVAVLATLIVVAIGIGIGISALGGTEAATPDAATAPPDIGADGRAVDLGPKAPGRCRQLLRGAAAPRITAVKADGRVVGQVETYYQPAQQRTCAKLVKPKGSPLHGKSTYLALTLCGDEGRCAHDWHPYRTDAGPVVVPSRGGCVSWRVSIGDRAGGWPVRDRVQRTSCS